MNKSELVDQLAEETGLSKKVSSLALDTVFEKITQAMSQGDEVTLIGFGTFGSKLRPERMGRNPKTGEAIQIEAARVPSFKPGKALKEAVKQEQLAEA